MESEKVRKTDNTQKIFFELLRAGLWDKEARLLNYGEIDFPAIYQMAESQGVVGVIGSGLEHVDNGIVPKEILLTFIGSTLQIESRNKAMCQFISETIEKMRKANIYGLLVKGQGLAQCYQKPLWRPAGDIDFFFSKSDFPKAAEFFVALSSEKVQDARYTKSFGVMVGPWFVEVHGTLRNALSSRMDREIDAVQRDIFYGGNVRSWMNGSTQVFMPGIDNDLFLLFTHFVRHFYKGGISIRQLSDWCRYLWTYNGKIDVDLLSKRIKNAGLMAEWNAFAALAVDYLGMPVEAMPLYENGKKLSKKANRIVHFILNGSQGKLRDTFEIGKVFPWHTILFLPSIFLNVNWMKVKEILFKR